MQSKNTLHVALGFDENYLIHFYALSTSILKNNAQHKLVFHALATGLMEAETETVKAYVSSLGGELNFYQVPDDFASGFTMHAWFGRATYYRLLFASLLPADIRKFLYLDTDTIVVGDLGELFAVDSSPFPVAAVKEPFMEPRPELGIPQTSIYFNAGVLLINRAIWVEQKISERTLEFLRLNHKITVYADQDALNATLIDNWFRLENRFNLMPGYLPSDLRTKDLAAYLKDKVIIHYTQFYKPWHILCGNKLRYLYFHYLKMTPVGTNPKPGGFEWKPKMVLALARIHAREFYYDHPLVPARVLKALQKKMSNS